MSLPQVRFAGLWPEAKRAETIHELMILLCLGLPVLLFCDSVVRDGVISVSILSVDLDQFVRQSLLLGLFVRRFL